MMPAEGGYYHWVKQAFGPFAGFLAGWMNLVVSWLDASIYPVLAAYYLAYFLPAPREGATIGGLEIPASFLSGCRRVLIWAITALQIRGARLTGLTANWVGVLILIPLSPDDPRARQLDRRDTSALPFLAGGQTLILPSAWGCGSRCGTTWGSSWRRWRATRSSTRANLPQGHGDRLPGHPDVRAAHLRRPVRRRRRGRPVQLWGVETGEDSTIGTVHGGAGITAAQLEEWGVNPGKPAAGTCRTWPTRSANRRAGPTAPSPASHAGL